MRFTALWLLLALLAPVVGWADGISSGPRNPLSTIDLIDEWCGSSETGEIGDRGWAFANGTVSTLAGESGAPCIKRHSTGAVINTIAHLHTSSSAAGQNINPADFFDATYRVRLQTNTLQEIRYGLMDAPDTAPPTDGIYLEQNTATDASWACVTRGASTETRTDTNVSVDTGSWFLLRIVRTTASAIQFWLNGTLVCTHTDNIPTADVMEGLQIENLEAVAKQHDIDYSRFIVRGLVR